MFVCAAKKRVYPRARPRHGQARTDAAASERSRIQCHQDAQTRCPNGANQGARGVLRRRAPPACWQDGAERRGAGRPAGQAVKQFEGRLLQVSKASASFVKIDDFRHGFKRQSTRIAKQNPYKFRRFACTGSGQFASLQNASSMLSG
ncbi:hypothetical protein BN2475_50157 [Paraburkholderia ribeironis]|uniref:Uncharacterized protein n=1 Tax=Paraburkholderia ribeironis TaxID=1247936 RepID=A0A1N7RKN2_9BURK|nr:hypothetical protein BN2475_50157 [Paraburkholderia ribeironis]